MAAALGVDTEPLIDSCHSSPLASKANSESESASENSYIPVSGSIEPSDYNYQSDSSVQSRKEYDNQSLAYLKSEEYRLLFRLPPDETLVQDFNCAFQESILLQGHMYLFVRRICFYSNIFGFETKKTIHFSEVTCVRKAKTAGIFPNAIEIVAGGKKYFFASFLSRDEAYRLIVDGWSQHTNGTEILIDHHELKSEIRNDEGLVIPEKVKDFEQQTHVMHLHNSNKDGDLSGECKLISNSEEEVTVFSSPLEVQEIGEEDVEPVVNAESLLPIEPFRWKMENADAPTVPDYYTKVAESKFPVQVEEFFNLFFADKAINFIDAFHKICGDKDFRCTSWSAHEQFGHTREVSFQHPIKIYFGAKFGHCHEVQKFRVYNNSHLVIETSQEISDVPYADYFRVEGLWNVEKDGNETNSCVLRVYVNVAFSKRTMWKGKIEQSTIEECREAYSVWIDNAHEILKRKEPENLDEEVSVTFVKTNDAASEGNEREDGSLTRLHDTNNAMQIPLVASDTKHVSVELDNSVHGGSSAASFGPLFKESLGRFSLYLKSQNHLSLVLVIASVLILLMQLSIILLLFRAPQVHLVSQTGHVDDSVSGRNDMAKAEAWLEKRVHYLKDEINMVDSQLEKMRHEQALLKEHFKGLEQFRKARK